MRLACALLLTYSLAAQTFEVASVKPSPPIGSPDRFRGVAKNGGPGTDDPTRVRYLNFGLKGLVSLAYDVPSYQITGPAWTEENRYVVIATLANGASREQARVMLQNLLVERFQLKTHDEQKTLLMYSLVVAKGGPKLAKPKPDATETSNMGMRSSGGHAQGDLHAYGEPVEWLVKMLSGQLQATVTDDTGLTDKYDYTMSWVPGGDDIGPDIATALQEQLGLKLISKKGPVRIVVIDHADMTPSEN